MTLQAFSWTANLWQTVGLPCLGTKLVVDSINPFWCRYGETQLQSIGAWTSYRLSTGSYHIMAEFPPSDHHSAQTMEGANNMISTSRAQDFTSFDSLVSMITSEVIKAWHRDNPSSSLLKGSGPLQKKAELLVRQILSQFPFVVTGQLNMLKRKSQSLINRAWIQKWLAKQEMLTSPLHLVPPFVFIGPWISIVVRYCLCHFDCEFNLVYFTS